ncbi:hypothetical protein PTKIN_Ptkin17bG0036800 [Pterospermum kingtungense]
MGIVGLLKKHHPVVKSVSKNLLRSINPSLYHISRRHLQQRHNHNNFSILLRRLQGNTVKSGMHYFTELSAENGLNFSPKQNLYLPLPRIPKFPLAVAGSCNGLLCLDNMHGMVALWNPSSNDFKILPQSSVERPPSAITNRFHFCTFGFDPKSEDYKVLRFVDNCFAKEDGSFGGSQRQVELYSLQSDSWKEISDPEHFEITVSFTYVNGICYQLACLFTPHQFILSFDFANENFSSLPLPDFGKPIVGAPYTCDLVEFDGLLAAIVYPKCGTEKSFELWVMNGSWTRESVIRLSGADRPLGLLKNGDMFLESSNHELLLFDLATGKLKNLGFHDYPKTMHLIPWFCSLENHSLRNR